MNKKIYGFRRGLITLLALMGMAYSSSAQVGIGTTTPDASAQLQIESTDKGILIPRVTSTSVVLAPATGLLVYQTGGIAGFYYNSGTAISPEWVKIATGSTEIADGTITNAKVSSGAAIAYSKLVLTNSIVNGDLTTNAVTTSKVADGAVTSAKIFDGTIVNADVSSAAAIAYSKLSLTNSIVSDDITTDAITTDKIADGTVISSKIADSAVSSLKLLTNAVTNAHVANGALDIAKLSTTGASTGNVLTYNGSALTWSTPPSGGSSQIDAFSAANSESAVVAVVLGGTSVPLPDYQNLSTFTVDGTNTVFTCPTTGTYRIDYRISVTTALLLSTRVLQNGAPIAASIISPMVAKDEFHNSFIVQLTAGDTLTLQMFGLLGAATLSGGASNGMTVQKL